MKKIQLYNTLTRKKEELIPLYDGCIRMYVCGVTVYDYCHLGHARALVTFDVIYRTLKYFDYDVTFVRNFTDIDDKIIQRAAERHIPWQELTAQFIDAFREDTAALGCESPTHEPLATRHIAEMIAIITSLQDKGIAYEAGGDVFFSVRAYKNYGKLSGKDIDDLESGARVDVMDIKKDPLDFALWKSAKPGEPFWESPWGKGRPGWHIECSAMSMKYLGETFDIHGGGRDLIFPHHENEIAQSEGCTGKEFARYWLHNGFVNINAEKMSKSLGNFLTIRDILTYYSGEAVRLFILSAHYRSPLDYTDKNLDDAASALKRFYELMARLDTYSPKAGNNDGDLLSGQIASWKDEMESALADDFNTARIVGSVFEWVRNFNKLLDEKADLKAATVAEFKTVLKSFAKALGIFGSDPQMVLTEMRQKGLLKLGVTEEVILKAIDDRKNAKAAKNYAEADKIRQDLLAKGIQLKDAAGGLTTWDISS